MSISIHNYEIYFIDYYEGKLSPEQTVALMDFIAAHPELKQEFDSYDYTALKPDLNVTFKKKKSLKKEESISSTTEQKIIALIEGDLDEIEKTEVEALISRDAAAAKLHTQYISTALLPEENIKYSDKASLKKSVAVIPIFANRVTFAAAAVIIILLGISSLLIFDFSATDTREDVRITKLTNLNNKLLSSSSTPIIIQSRAVEDIRWSTVEREEITIERLQTARLTEAISIPSYQMTIISQEIRYVNPSYRNLHDEAEALADASESKTAAGRIISGFFGKIAKPFKDDNPAPKDPNPKGFSFWDIAEFGVKGINALGDHEYTLVREYNEKGNVKGVMILEE